MKRFFEVCFVCLAFVSCGIKSDVRSFEAMNTFMTVRSFGKNSVAANSLIQNRMESYERMLSVTNDGSLLFRLNENPEEGIVVDGEIFKLVDFALCMAEKTSGALNPVLYPVTKAWGFTSEKYRVPEEKEISALLEVVDYRKVNVSVTSDSEINDGFRIRMDKGMMMDLGAVAKGFAGDRAVEILSENGITSALLDLGGNIQALGGKPDGTPWSVGIKNPWGGEPVCGIRIKDCAVVTSGGYERFFTDEKGKRYIHIFDSRTGYPVENDIAAVSVISSSGLYADSLSTSLFVMGFEKAVSFWKSSGDFDFVIIKNSKEIFYTEGLKDKIFLMTENASCIEK
ncbi:MAG: FAD:protein FMN transferase [Treponema sp.]|jgi:thiamine biosynthesis lipoprotein|nr:FAD:protein FMN transferase [Treponema sp.]